MTAQDYIEVLHLLPHPEGGYYKETYRSKGKITNECLPSVFHGERNYSTAIYYLLQQGDFSAFHKINSDECWHFYGGDTLLIHVIDIQGDYSCVRLGSKLNNGGQPQFVVPACSWFASEPAPASIFSFVGCTVAPGFDFADFEMASKEELLKAFPAHTSVISKLCRI